MNFGITITLFEFLVGAVLVFLAITIARDNISHRLNRITGAMLFFAGLGPIFMGLETVISQSEISRLVMERSAYYNLRCLWNLFFPCLLLLSWTFPVNRLANFRFRYLPMIIFVPQLMQTLTMLFHDNMSGFLGSLRADPTQQGFTSLLLKPVGEIASWLQLLLTAIHSYDTVIFGLVNLLYALVAIYFVESHRRSIVNPRLSSQARIVAWSLRIGLGGYLLAFIGTLFYEQSFNPTLRSLVLVTAIAIAAAMFVYGTIRYRFLDLQLVFRQSVVYTLTSALLVGGFVLLVNRSEQLLTPLFGRQAEAVSYVFIVVVLLMFQPVNSGIDNIIRSLFIRTRTDPRHVLERFSRQVISVFDPPRLRQIIEDTMKTAILVETVTLVMYDDEVEEYAVVASGDSARRIVLNREDLMLRGINLLDAPTYYRSLSDFREGSKLAKILDERRTQLIVTMKDADHLLGFLALSKKAAGYRYTPEDMNLLEVLSNQMVSALTNARLYVDSLERLRLQEEVSMARQIQLDLLPKNPPSTGQLVISARSDPSRTIGGDFYDFVELPDDRIGIVIADASGKGMPAALMIAQIQALIRSEINNGTRIDVMLRNMNEQMARATSAEKYVTLFYGELDCNQGEFHYANAGHNYPIIARKDGSIELLKEGGPIIGALLGMEYDSATVKINPDDVLFMFTDGLSESMDEQEREYGEDRIRKFIVNNRTCSPDELIENIVNDARQFDPTDPPRDDTTLIAIKLNSCNGGSPDAQ